MANIRAERLARIADRIPLQHVMGPKSGDLLVLGWGCTYGAIRSAVRRMRQQGYSVAGAHLRYLNPFPKNLGAILSSYKTILVPELNMGQLSLLLQAKYPSQVIVPFNKVQGLPFKITENLRPKLPKYWVLQRAHRYRGIQIWQTLLKH